MKRAGYREILRILGAIKQRIPGLKRDDRQCARTQDRRHQYKVLIDLSGIVERTRIAPDGQHARNTDPDGHITRLTGDELVSMNVWGFTPAIFPELRAYFSRFITQHPNDLTAEAFLPSFVNDLVTAGRARVRVLQTPDSWFGITYREDLPRVAASIRALVAAGHYPERLS